MSEFMSFDKGGDHWDLQAIVKGQDTSNNINLFMMNNNNVLPSYNSCLESLDIEFYDCYSNHVQENATILNELEQLCKPFPKYEESSCMNEVKQEIVVDKGCCANASIVIPRGRKNKHKMTLVQQASGDRVVSDKWNWRKYGEKVIKGSPYPRSYYRCSNSGGCLARKQVEQSISDPRIFQITYIDEHSHPYPTRRPSQAGRSARRFDASMKTHTCGQSARMSSRNTTPASSSVNRSDRENRTTEYVVGDYGSKKVFEDNFFAGLEYLEGLEMELLCGVGSESL